MKRLACLTALALAIAAATPGFAQTAKQAPRRADGFASDFQTVPVMGNTPGANGSRFESYVAILNPTANSFPIDVTLYDSTGTVHTATITLAAGEQKTYENFLEEVFQYTGGGAVQFRSSDSAGGQRNNRFVINTEVLTSGTRYNTVIPVLEFLGSSSKSFAVGVNVDSTTRTNVGCMNQSDVQNTIVATVYDKSGTQNLGSVTLNLAPKAWGQAGVGTVVSNGYVQFTPSDNAVCYAVVVDNATNDGRFIAAAEYTP